MSLNPGLFRTACAVLLVLCLPHPVLAQRALHWDSIDVDATLDASGTLHVAETQAMVFTGAWNGGERRFDVRPRQRLSLAAISRLYPGGWRELTEDADLDDVDDYAWTDARTLRWRSRGVGDRPFANTAIRYLLRYQMSGVLVKDEAGFLLNHDFVFTEREGDINRFRLRLTLDPVWQPHTAIPEVYAAERLAPGTGFVVTVPLQYTGTGAPIALDSSRPREIVLGVAVLLLSLGLGLAALFVREERHGRFAPLTSNIDETWLREHLFTYPAEVVGAAWDEGISTPEVVALIARMVSEGKLESTVTTSGSMTLRLKVDRDSLSGHERALVDGLFFNGRTETSTEQVRQHYKRSGFDPADTIRRELETAVEHVLPKHPRPRRVRLVIQMLVIAGIGLTGFELFARSDNPGGALGLVVGVMLALGFAWGLGTAFRAHIHWGLRAAWACLTPTLLTFAAGGSFLWFVAGQGIVEPSVMLVAGTILLALAVMLTSIHAMRSRQPRAGVAFRKRLASSRAFFLAELQKDEPALHDDWFPWILAFGLADRVDRWSTRRSTSSASTDRASAGTFSSSAGSSSPGWTGFAGGRSGGAGGGAAWVTAVSGMAAGVSTPGSSGSSGGSSSSSSSSSSGGGGGGGW